MTNSFLPDDYIAQKAERRTNVICLSLFMLVMLSIFGVFVLSTRQRSAVAAEELALRAEIQRMADEIDQVVRLEDQRHEMIEKAEIAAALVERVPRSILLAEIVNRMPASLTLLEFDMKSRKVTTAPVVDVGAKGKGRGPKRAPTMKEAAEAVKDAKVEAPRYEISLSLTGVAPDDKIVSEFIKELGASDLLREVSLEYAEATELNDIDMREFKATMRLADDADVRQIEPLQRSRTRGPMGGPVRFGTTSSTSPSTNPTTGSPDESSGAAGSTGGGRSWNPLHLLSGGKDD